MAMHIDAPLVVGGAVITPGVPYFGGKSFYVDYVNGSDGQDGLSPVASASNPRTGPKKTLDAAYDDCTDGAGDTIFILSGDHGTTYTQRLSEAFTWAKDNTHLIGLASGVATSSRARVSELSTFTLGAAGTLFTVSGSNCRFQNIAFWQATDIANAACVGVTGSRNAFVNCHIAGITGATAGADDGGCCLYLQGSENEFHNCVIGISTIGRSAASAELRIARASASAPAERNIFADCKFLSWATGTGHFYVQWATNGATQTQSVNDTTDWTLFQRCNFIGRLIGTGCATMTVGLDMSASINGVVFLEDCKFAQVTDIVTGDASTRVFANSYKDAQGGIAGLYTGTATT